MERLCSEFLSPLFGGSGVGGVYSASASPKLPGTLVNPECTLFPVSPSDKICLTVVGQWVTIPQAVLQAQIDTVLVETLFIAFLHLSKPSTLV